MENILAEDFKKIFVRIKEFNDEILNKNGIKSLNIVSEKTMCPALEIKNINGNSRILLDVLEINDFLDTIN